MTRSTSARFESYDQDCLVLILPVILHQSSPVSFTHSGRADGFLSLRLLPVFNYRLVALTSPHPKQRTIWQAAQVAEVLKRLLRGSDESALLAYQIAFDLVESEHQHFVMEVNKNLPQKKKAETECAAEEKTEVAQAGEMAAASPVGGEEQALATPVVATSGMELDGEGEGPEENEEFSGRMEKLRQVLVDGFGIDLSLNFLYKMNKTDLLLMKNIKGALETRNSVLHNVTVVAHGYMQAGTTVSFGRRSSILSTH